MKEENLEPRYLGCYELGIAGGSFIGFQEASDFGRQLPPHPCPLPKGEGERSSRRQ